MMVQSHVLGALLVGLVLARFARFGRREWALAFGFSVVIDLDHLLQVPAYVATHPPQSLADLAPAKVMAWGADWQGFMHTWWGLGLVIPFVLAYRSWVPAVFWGLHMFQDFVIARNYVRFGGPTEFALDLALVAACAGIFWVDHWREQAHPNLARHVAATFGILR